MYTKDDVVQCRIFDTTDAMAIAQELLKSYKPPIAAFIHEEDFKELRNKERIEAINSFTKEWTIGELRNKKVLFITYHNVLEVKPIEANWERFMGNKSIVYIGLRRMNEAAHRDRNRR